MSMLLLVMMWPGAVETAWAQTAPGDTLTSATADSLAAPAQVDQVIGEEREIIFEETITAQPARPLIQFTFTRPRPSFTEVRVGPTSRMFMEELRKGSGMEVTSPAIEVLFSDSPGGL